MMPLRIVHEKATPGYPDGRWRVYDRLTEQEWAAVAEIRLHFSGPTDGSDPVCLATIETATGGRFESDDVQMTWEPA